MQQLRDRLSRALGQQQQSGERQTLPAAVPVQTNTQPPQVPQYYPQVRDTRTALFDSPAADTSVCLCCVQGRSATTVTSWSNQTPTALPSVPRPLVPATDPQVQTHGAVTDTKPAGSINCSFNTTVWLFGFFGRSLVGFAPSELYLGLNSHVSFLVYSSDFHY